MDRSEFLTEVAQKEKQQCQTCRFNVDASMCITYPRNKPVKVIFAEIECKFYEPKETNNAE
jgi:hypothetical protein|nr:MAG TPA: hypothetical protein [Caudoviricetes sp.]